MNKKQLSTIIANLFTLQPTVEENQIITQNGKKILMFKSEAHYCDFLDFISSAHKEFGIKVQDCHCTESLKHCTQIYNDDVQYRVLVDALSEIRGYFDDSDMDQMEEVMRETLYFIDDMALDAGLQKEAEDQAVSLAQKVN